MPTRREFLKFCSSVTAAIGLGPAYGPRLARAFAALNRPTVLWLHFAECAACTEAVLRISPNSTAGNTMPWFDDLILSSVSLDYHEILMAASGSTAETILHQTAARLQGSFFCVVEGSIPTAEGGRHGMIGGRTMLEIAQAICPKARAVIAIGTCASFGGLPAANPNPTGARGVRDALPGLAVPVINCPGCPPNPVSFVGILASYLLRGSAPALDSLNRPRFAYSDLGTVHNQCPLQADLTRCLITQGCKGPIAENNCPTIRFNDATNFPMLAGHPCIGCSQPQFWDRHAGFYTS
jgi:[NiFe] hydrogenase small subunit